MDRLWKFAKVDGTAHGPLMEIYGTGRHWELHTKPAHAARPWLGQRALPAALLWSQGLTKACSIPRYVLPLGLEDRLRPGLHVLHGLADDALGDPGRHASQSGLVLLHGLAPFRATLLHASLNLVPQEQRSVFLLATKPSAAETPIHTWRN